MNYWENYKKFHHDYIFYGDCDPAYPLLNFIAEIENFDLETRYFMAWVYSTCYNDCTTYFIIKSLPHFSELTQEHINDFWQKEKNRLVFTTDRLKVKSFNKFPEMFASYQKLVGKNQEAAFRSKLTSDKVESYEKIYKFCQDLFYFGRFSLFLYLETLELFTELPIEINTIPLEEAESSRNGLCYALNKPEWVSKKNQKVKLDKTAYEFLYEKLHQLVSELKAEQKDIKTTYWNTETALCAYKKLFWESRYLGFYIDRSLAGLKKAEQLYPELSWSNFWMFRREFFNPFFLGELGGWANTRGERCKIFNKHQSFIYPYEHI